MSARESLFSFGHHVAIVGSRGFKSPGYYIDYEIARIPTWGAVVSGGARGVDSLAEASAKAAGLHVISYRPEKDTRDGVHYGRFVIRKYVDGEPVGLIERDGYALSYATFPEAAKRRNWHIVKDAERVVALWDGISSGTAHSIAAASRLSRVLSIWMDGDS